MLERHLVMDSGISQDVIFLVSSVKPTMTTQYFLPLLRDPNSKGPPPAFFTSPMQQTLCTGLPAALGVLQQKQSRCMSSPCEANASWKQVAQDWVAGLVAFPAAVVLQCGKQAKPREPASSPKGLVILPSGLQTPSKGEQVKSLFSLGKLCQFRRSPRMLSFTLPDRSPTQ